jgi:hypothetical protein
MASSQAITLKRAEAAARVEGMRALLADILGKECPKELRAPVVQHKDTEMRSAVWLESAADLTEFAGKKLLKALKECDDLRSTLSVLQGASDEAAQAQVDAVQSALNELITVQSERDAAIAERDALRSELDALKAKPTAPAHAAHQPAKSKAK